MGFEQSVAWWCFDCEDIDALDLIDTLKSQRLFGGGTCAGRQISNGGRPGFENRGRPSA